MIKRLFAISFIFFCATVGWAILSVTVFVRSDNFNESMGKAVGQLWGQAQEQKAPSVFYETEEVETTTIRRDGLDYKEEHKKVLQHPLPILASDLKADLKLEHRQKGLMWYATYQVDFSGRYQVQNNTNEERQLKFLFPFPEGSAVYDNFKFNFNGKEIAELRPEGGRVCPTVAVGSGEKAEVAVSYRSQGMDQWWYNFGCGVQQMRNFSLLLNTDFTDIDFPDKSISPTAKVQQGKGWALTWRYDNLISSANIGLELPKKLNPGPWAGMVTAAAPVSLFLFFFLVFLFTTLKGIPLHPMHYFFLATGFFSFHLLLAYLVDHVSIHLAFAVCSLVSIFLVVTYMRLVVGRRFAFVEVGLAQFVYLVFFSYTFFFKGYTGLAITILCIVTLFIVMQATGRLDWAGVFKRSANSGPSGPGLPNGMGK